MIRIKKQITAMGLPGINPRSAEYTLRDNLGRLYPMVDGTLINSGEIGYHLSNIIGGMYSLDGQPDKALIESRVRSVSRSPTAQACCRA